MSVPQNNNFVSLHSPNPGYRKFLCHLTGHSLLHELDRVVDGSSHISPTLRRGSGKASKGLSNVEGCFVREGVSNMTSQLRLQRHLATFRHHNGGAAQQQHAPKQTYVCSQRCCDELYRWPLGEHVYRL
jgi:hypothetical protein